MHSLRQLGNERVDFGNEHAEGDLSYVEFKIRSVIMGDNSRRTKVEPLGHLIMISCISSLDHLDRLNHLQII